VVHVPVGTANPRASRRRLPRFGKKDAGVLLCPRGCKRSAEGKTCAKFELALSWIKADGVYDKKHRIICAGKPLILTKIETVKRVRALSRSAYHR